MSYENALKTANIVRDAGGCIVGRTRLQKIAYLLSAAGLESGLPFIYKHYGPFSEELAAATRDARLLGILEETEQQATWGGTYSTFTVSLPPDRSVPTSRCQLARIAAEADAVELELAATAVFIAKEGNSDPWRETARRKPEKANLGRIEKAKVLYRKLAAIEAPTELPRITADLR
jgi:uncharacterized protein